jgi:mono/diheme cytochrome c family protein
MLIVLAAVALGATGCFSSKVANTTISGEITVGEGTSAQTVNPAESTGASTATTGATSTAATSTAATSTAGTTTAGGTGADIAAGKTTFTATCGGCHTLKDAGTTGKVGPDLDSLAPLTVETVANQIKNGGGPMPPMLVTGQTAANVAAYVASVAGK